MLKVTCKICAGEGFLRLEDDPICAVECSTCRGSGKVFDFAPGGVSPAPRPKKPWVQSIIACLIVLSALWCATTSMVFSWVHPEQTQMEIFQHIPRSFVLEFGE